MNFQIEYDNLIKFAQEQKREKGLDVYYEKHHIIPRSIGGTNKKDNLVLLTAQEHYKAHELLALANPDNNSLLYAWNMMSCRTGSGQAYAILKERHSKIMSERFKGKKLPRTQRDNISKGNMGKVCSEGTKQKISLAQKGVPKSEEMKRKISNGFSKEMREQIGASRRGVKFSSKHLKNLSDALKGRLAWNKKIDYNGEEFMARDLAKVLNCKLKELKERLKNV
tara:strand:- start:155 stop:826 length:672 start_codon:yes stop_codon:yes gene_type:complete